MKVLCLLGAFVACASAGNYGMTRDDWNEKCPNPTSMKEVEHGAFSLYDLDGDGAITESEVETIYVQQGKGQTAAKTAWKVVMAAPGAGAGVTEEVFNKVGMKQICIAPKIADEGACPQPYILDGEQDYFLLKSEHYELRQLSWDEMTGMNNEELRAFLREQEVPHTVRVKVLDLHDDKKGAEKTVAKICVPTPPVCADPLEFDPAAGACIPPRPHYRNPVINDAWIAPVLVVDGTHHDEKAPRMHMEVETDPTDKLLVKERRGEEEALWNFEKVRRATAH